MKSYMPFLEYLSEKGLWLDWNDEDQEYNVVGSRRTRSGMYANEIIVTLPPRTVRHDFNEAVEIVSTSLELFNFFG